LVWRAEIVLDELVATLGLEVVLSAAQECLHLEEGVCVITLREGPMGNRTSAMQTFCDFFLSMLYPSMPVRMASPSLPVRSWCG
jgi:hypothetical protein